MPEDDITLRVLHVLVSWNREVNPGTTQQFPDYLGAHHTRLVVNSILEVSLDSASCWLFRGRALPTCYRVVVTKARGIYEED